MNDHNVHMSHCYSGEYAGTCKYGVADCPAKNRMSVDGTLHDFLEKGKMAMIAKDLHRDGYICISNSYRKVGRPDRDDWHVVLAATLRCAPADFYLTDGSGLCPRWREHHVRCITTDTITVPDMVYSELKKIYNRS